MKILDTSDQLSKEFTCFCLLESLFLNDEFEEFAFGDVLHDEEELFGCLYDFVELNEVGVPNLFEYVYFASNSSHIGHVCYPALLQDLDCHFFSCQGVNTQFNFAESTLSEVTCHDVVTNCATALQ